MHVYSNLSQDSCGLVRFRAVWAEGLGGIEGVVGRCGLGRGVGRIEGAGGVGGSGEWGLSVWVCVAEGSVTACPSCPSLAVQEGVPFVAGGECTTEEGAKAAQRPVGLAWCVRMLELLSTFSSRR